MTSLDEALPLPDHGARHVDRGFALLTKLTDASLIIFTLVVTANIYDQDWTNRYSLAAILGAMAFILLAELAGIYRPWRGEASKRQFFQILLVWLQVAAVLLLLAYVFKTTANFSRLATLAWFGAVPFLLSGWRFANRSVIDRLGGSLGAKRRTVIWGTGAVGEQLVKILNQSPWLGLELTHYIHHDDRDPQHGHPATPPSANSPASQTGALPLTLQHLESQLHRIEALARAGDIDILYIALPIRARDSVAKLLDRLADTTVSVYLVPDFFTSELMFGRWSSLQGIPLISVYETPFLGADGWLKRIEDIVLASLILLLIALPLIGIALAVKLTSRGPVIFKQRRYGLNGQEVLVWKFRTMRVCDDGDRFIQASRQDPRITPLGRLLRRTSLDELPQFINVLMGDLAIVGPRPHPVAMNEHYRRQIKGYMLRHKVRPGITGWAQINGWRGETDTLEKINKRIEHDLWYIRNWSLWLDLKIIVMTILNGFVGRNAY